jgi:hypothetical protein
MTGTSKLTHVHQALPTWPLSDISSPYISTLMNLLLSPRSFNEPTERADQLYDYYPSSLCAHDCPAYSTKTQKQSVKISQKQPRSGIPMKKASGLIGRPWVQEWARSFLFPRPTYRAFE